MLLNNGAREDSWESPGLQGDPTSPSWSRSVLGVHWKDWCWSWNSNTLATSCEELTHWKRLWCWEGLVAAGEGDDREWDGWMASPTRWAWVWVNSWSLWWTRRPGVLWFMGSQRVRHNWVTELNWIGRLSLARECIKLCIPLINICEDDYKRNQWELRRICLSDKCVKSNARWYESDCNVWVESMWYLCLLWQIILQDNISWIFHPYAILSSEY